MNTHTSTRADFWPLALHAAALVVPPLLLAIGTSLDRTAGGAEIDIYLERVGAAPWTYLASGLLLVCGMAALVTTAAALIRLAAGARRAALLRVGAILLAVWGICGIAGVSLGYTAGWVGVAVQDDVTASALKTVFEGITYSPWGMIGGGIGGGAFVLGVIATGVGLLIMRGVPRWTGIIVLLSPVALFTGGPLHILLLMVGGFVLLAVGLAGAIPTLLRKPRLVESQPHAVRTSADATV